MHISAPPSLATRFHKIANDAVPPPLFDPFQSMPSSPINAKFISSPSFEFLASPFFVCVTRMKGNIACILSVYASSKPEIRSDASVGLGSILRSIRRKGKGEEERTTLSVVASVTRSVVARRTSPSSFLNVIRVSSIRDSLPSISLEAIAPYGTAARLSAPPTTSHKIYGLIAKSTRRGQCAYTASVYNRRAEGKWMEEARGRARRREESWKDVDGREREKEKTKRILLLPPGYEEGEVIRLTFIAFTIA